jgi:hypothetical protein
MKNLYNDTGKDLFKELIDKGLAPKDIISKLKANHGKFFSEIKPSQLEEIKYVKDLEEYNIKHADILNRMSKIERNKYFESNPRPIKPINTDRPELQKALGRFTLDSLSKINNNDFQGIKLDTNLKSGESLARGLFKDSPGISEKGKAVYLNPDVNRQDILSTIVHEGNHALEHYNPYITNTIQGFLNKKLDEEQNKIGPNQQANLSKDYLLNLYKGVQNIINLNKDFGDNYKLTNSYQNQLLTKNELDKLNNLKTPYGNYPLKNPIGEKFEEIPAFALETLMRNNHLWNINENTNDDSRKLLRRIMKEQQQQYRNLGLVNTNQQEEGSARYKYNKARVPIYAPSADRPNYNLVDKAFIDKIEALRKPFERRKNFNQTTTTSTTPTSIQTFQNPITQSPYTSTTPSTYNNQNPITQFMNQNQSSYQGNQLTQLMQQPDSTKRSREGYDSEIDNTINKRSRLNTMTTTTTPSVNRTFTFTTLNRRHSI